jgi:hypothetical protein
VETIIKYYIAIKVLFIVLILFFVDLISQQMTDNDIYRMPIRGESYEAYRNRMIDSLKIEVLDKGISSLKKQIKSIDDKIAIFQKEKSSLPINDYNILIPEFNYDNSGKTEKCFYKINNQIKEELSILLKSSISGDSTGHMRKINISLYPDKLGLSIEEIAQNKSNLQEEGKKIIELSHAIHAHMIIKGAVTKMGNNSINVRIVIFIAKSKISTLFSLEEKFVDNPIFVYDFNKVMPYDEPDKTGNYKKLLSSALIFTADLITIDELKGKGSPKDIITALFYLDNIRKKTAEDNSPFTSSFKQAIWAETVYLYFDLYNKVGQQVFLERAIQEIESLEDLQKKWNTVIEDEIVKDYLYQLRHFAEGDDVQEVIDHLKDLYEFKKRKCAPIAEFYLEALIKKGTNSTRNEAYNLYKDFIKDGICSSQDQNRFATRYKEIYGN